MNLKILLPISICFVINVVSAADPIDRFLGADDLYIGFGEDCYLFWRGDKGNTKNAEFRCGKSSGDPISISKIGSGRFKIRSNGRDLYWRGDSGDVKNAEFRKYGGGDVFWIRPEKNGLFSIGAGNCPLYWRGDKGNTKNAEFRCGEPVSDTFWIKNDGCKTTSIKMLPTDNRARYDGEEIIGIASAVSCSTSVYQSLALSHTKEVVEEVGIEMSKTTEMNWEMSTSVSVEAGASLFGVKSTVTVSQSFSMGGSISYGSSRSKSTSTGTSAGSSITTNYNVPGGALIVGYRKRYVFDKSNLPAEMTVTCKGGRQFKYPTTIRLRSKSFGHAHYKTFAAKYLPGKCRQDDECLYRDNYRSYDDLASVAENFKRCFPAGVGEVVKR